MSEEKAIRSESAASESAAGAAPVDDAPGNFVEDLVREDVAAGKHGGRVATRFPPEPNGYLHIGHAKSICLNFGLAETFGGTCNLRFDDTNPEAEDDEFVQSIQEDVKWLGFSWSGEPKYASDYFEQLYAFSVKMIEEGKAYVDSQTLEQIREGRGDFYKPGVESPFRSRSVAENLDLFARMRAGEFEDGAHVLRAKGDMQGTDVKMRDPVMYRIRRVHHHRTKDAWCIYPMYDWAHGQSDYLEKITHSICTLEFINHRPLYDFFLDAVGAPADRPKQTEFAKLVLTYTVMSKRRLTEMVAKGVVSGWDDPRMPTLAGQRRRGVPPEALRALCERVGVATKDSIVDVTLYENAIRERLNAHSPRTMAVLRPLKVVIENFPEGETLEFQSPFNPDAPDGPSRVVPFSRELYIERDDFMEDPPKKFFRLAPGKEVRLRYACILKCVGVVKNEAGEVTELRCEWDPQSKGGNAHDGRKVKSTIHWVSAKHAITAEVRLYDRLFSVEDPMAEAGKDKSYLDFVNPESLEVVTGAKLEPSLGERAVGESVQFERLGYFCKDRDSKEGAPVWNRTIGLKDSWAKAQGSDK
jgi:glutaminyl-tRNA synthetase